MRGRIQKVSQNLLHSALSMGPGRRFNSGLTKHQVRAVDEGSHQSTQRRSTSRAKAWPSYFGGMA